MEKTDIANQDANANGDSGAASPKREATQTMEESAASISLKVMPETHSGSAADRDGAAIGAQCITDAVEIETAPSAAKGAAQGASLIAEKAAARAPAQVTDYSLVEEVGRGGMGVVYRARHKKLDKTMAIKLLHRELANDPINLKRFAQEARAAKLLTHPNLVSVYDSGTADDGQPFLVMDFLEGRTLDAIIKDEGPLPLDRFFNIFSQVCEGLAHAHRKGVVHRDLKPSNIMILDKGADQPEFVKLVDFGIARVFQQAARDKKVTQTGDVIGSPTYMSPEQCLAGKLDARSDIYSLAVVMYEALTGKPPFSGDNAIQTILCHMQDNPEPLLAQRADLLPGLEEAIMQALEKRADERFQSIEEFSYALEVARNPENVKPKRFAKVARAWRKLKAKAANQKKRIAIAAAAVVILSAAFIVPNTLAPHESWQELEKKGEDAFSLHDSAHAFEYWQSAIKEAQRANASPKEQAALNYEIGSTFMRYAQGHPNFHELSLPYFLAARAIYEQHPELGPMPIDWLYECGFALEQTGNPAAAKPIYESLVARLDQPNAESRSHSASFIRLDLARVQSDLNENDAAERSLQDALRIAQRIPDPVSSASMVGVVYEQMGNFYQYAGRPKEAALAKQKQAEAGSALYKPRRTADKIQGHTDSKATSKLPLSIPSGIPLKTEKR